MVYRTREWQQTTASLALTETDSGGYEHMKTVSFFNHKGGVGKTTLLFNVGVALGRGGTKVLLIDADAQTNLTGAALNAERYEKIVADQQTLYDQLLPVIRGTGDVIDVPPVQIRDNVWLIPGSIQLSLFEAQLPQAWTDTFSGQYRAFQQTGALHRLIRAAAKDVGADLALIDLGPSVGALNRIALLGSDGFVVPLAPDLFSLTAMPSVGANIATWVAEWKVILGQGERTGVLSDFAPGDTFKGEPRPLGYISQQFASYRSAPAAAFKRWLQDIPSAYEKHVVDQLSAAGIAVPDSPHQIGEVRNLSSLVPRAQDSNAAIFELSGAEARGAQYIRARDTFKDFKQLGDSIVDRLG